MENVERAVEADDVEGCDAGNLAFHSALVEFTGYRRLVRLYDSMNRELNMFRRRSLGDPQNRREACVEHRGIIEALKKGDPTHAANVMWKTRHDGRQPSAPGHGPRRPATCPASLSILIAMRRRPL